MKQFCPISLKCLFSFLFKNKSKEQMQNNFNFVLGLKKIQELTKQSMKTKPFCLAVSKDWTIPSGKIGLREIYTKLVWKKKNRKACMVEREFREDITKILSEERLEDEGPVRILVQGNFYPFNV